LVGTTLEAFITSWNRGVDAIDAVRPAAEAKQIRLQTLLDLPASPLAGDPDRLRASVLEFALNAVKFTRRPGEIVNITWRASR
jgi:signal transduction histidine kinase